MWRGCDARERLPRSDRPQQIAGWGRSGVLPRCFLEGFSGVRVTLMTNPSLTTILAKPAPEETQTCWSCGTALGTTRAVHFCEACGKVQPPAPVDYFAFFGLPRKLNIDVKALDKDFYELSRK